MARLSSLILAGLAALALTGCNGSGLSETETLATFRSGELRYELRISPNSQGASMPCIEVVANFDEGSGGVAACPTESSENDEYGSAVEFRDSYFVLGYGLEDGEEIMLETAERIVTTEEVGGTRFFVIELTSSPGAESFEIPIGTPDGIVRSIPSHGVDP